MREIEKYHTNAYINIRLNWNTYMRDIGKDVEESGASDKLKKERKSDSFVLIRYKYEGYNGKYKNTIQTLVHFIFFK
jgi:hypothetical protein